MKCRAAIARIDQHPDIGIALRDDAGKGRVDALERFKVFEPLNVGLGGLHRAFLGGKVANGVVHFLLGDGIRLNQVLITRCSSARKPRLACAVTRSARACASC